MSGGDSRAFLRRDKTMHDRNKANHLLGDSIIDNPKIIGGMSLDRMREILEWNDRNMDAENLTKEDCVFLLHQWQHEYTAGK